MKNFIPIIIILLNFISAQLNNQFIYKDKCGTPPLTEDLIIGNEVVNKWFQENQQVRTNLEVPVVFHIIYEYETTNGGYVSENRITNQINVINNAFNSLGLTFILQDINYVENSNWYLNDDEYTYKQQLAVDPANTLNIYTTSAQGYAGYAYLPNSWSENSYMHGVVLSPSVLPGGSYPYDQGDTAVHEIGHYLGLYHTFQGGCNSTGDYIDDTPAQDDCGQSSGADISQCSTVFECNDNLDTCSSEGLDPVRNYMNYSNDYCINNFTSDQNDRMTYMLNTYKPNLGCSEGYDCAGVCGGNQELDCSGICGGNLEYDCCGVCGGNNSLCSTCCGADFNNDCSDDCYVQNNETCCLNSEVDQCGICNGNNSCLLQAISAQYTFNEDEIINIYLSATNSNDNTIFLVTDAPDYGVLAQSGLVITYTPNANYNGFDNFKFIASDDNFTSNEATISLTINAVNDAPYIEPISNSEINSNSTFSYNLQASDVDGDTLVFTATSNVNCQINIDNSTLTITPNNDYVGDIIITVTVSDGNTTHTIEFTLTVISNNIIGDVDQNGSVNGSDIVMLVDLILNDNLNISGDVDQNGSVNVSDIVLLVNLILNS